MPRVSFGTAAGPAIELEVDGYRSVIRKSLVVVYMPSKSNVEKLYRVEHTPVATVCECPGFEYKNTCWHIDRAKELFRFPSEADVVS